MWYDTRLTELLKITYPVIQAPMAGAAASPRLVAAVSNAGGLGSLGAGYLSPEQIRQAIQEIRNLTDRPFAVNLLIVEEVKPDPLQIQAMQAILRRYREELGLPTGPELTTFAPPLAEQLAAVAEARVPIFSFAFGIPLATALEAFKAAGTVVLGTATTVREALALEQAGVDAIVAQGSEAGGHRGTFLGEAEGGMIGIVAMVPQMVDAAGIPVVAAGGIMDGRGLVAALALGAAGVQMGTAFLTCAESGANPAYRAALLAGMDDATAITRTFSGKPARGIRNRFMSEMEPYERSVPPYPVQNALTRDIRAEAARQGKSDFLSLWAGQGLRMSRETSAGRLVGDVIAQASAIVDGLRSG